MPACIGSGPGQHSQTAKSESVWKRGRRVSADSVHCYAGVAAAPRLALAQPVALAHQSGRPPSPARRFCCAALLADQNWWASGLRYRRSSNRASAGLYAENWAPRGRTTCGLGLLTQLAVGLRRIANIGAPHSGQ